MVWAAVSGPPDGLLLVSVQLGVDQPDAGLEGDFTTQDVVGITDGSATLGIPNDNGQPMDSGYVVRWARTNGDVWYFQSSGMTPQRLIDLVLQTTPLSATSVRVADDSMELLSKPSGDITQVRRAAYTISGLHVGLSVRDDGGAFGNLISIRGPLLPVEIAGNVGFRGDLGNGQVEVVWDAGNGWWAELSIHPGLAERADEIITSIKSSTMPPSAPAQVSYLHPPPEVTMRPIGAVTVPDPTDGSYSVAIGDLGLVVGSWSYGSQSDIQVDAIGFGGNARRIKVDGKLGMVLAYGPGDVVYATYGEPLKDFAVVAVPLSGDQSGTVVASAQANVTEYGELPPSAFGHGEQGVTKRLNAVVGSADAAVIEYVDVHGHATPLSETAPPSFFADIPLSVDHLGGHVQSSDGVGWDLEIGAASDRAGSYIGPSPPAPSSNGAGVYWTHIGPNLRPDQDFGEPSMWVIAQLEADGAATWWSIPSGWTVVASDAWGTVLAKQDGLQLNLAIAEFVSGA